MSVEKGGTKNIRMVGKGVHRLRGSFTEQLLYTTGRLMLQGSDVPGAVPRFL